MSRSLDYAFGSARDDNGAASLEMTGMHPGMTGKGVQLLFAENNCKLICIDFDIIAAFRNFKI